MEKWNKDGVSSDSTLESYIEAIEKDPQSSDCYCNLAEYYWRHGELSYASTAYIRALEVSMFAPPMMRKVNSFLRAAGRCGETELLFMWHDNACKKISEYTEKKLLAVYDLAVQPYSIGDMLVFQMGALAVAKLRGIEHIDICFISDTRRIPLDPVFANANADGNRLFNLFTLLPLIQLNHAIGSVIIQDSFPDTVNFIKEKGKIYEIWPTEAQLLGDTYNTFEIMHLIDELYRTTNTWPLLSLPSALAEWVSSFYKIHAKDKVPVTINLRNNPHFHHKRNSDMLAWVSFFQRCNTQFPAQFIIVCSQSEVIPELRTCPNVTIAKDYNTSIVQDVALVMSSAFHMGSPSGPSIIPRFSDRPYVIFDADDISHLLAGYGSTFICESDEVARFSFSHPFQRTLLLRETEALIFREFCGLWNVRDWSKWVFENTVSSEAKGVNSTLGWLR